MRRRVAAGLLAGLLLAAALPALDVEFPLLQAFSWFPYGENGRLAAGRAEFSLRLGYSNIFSYSLAHRFFNDMELASAVLGLRVGLGRGLTGEIYLNARRTQGGFLDRGIEGFHTLFAFPDAGRPDYPRDQVRYRFGDHFDFRAGRGALLPPVVALLAELAHTRRFRLLGRLAVGVPLGEVAGYASGKGFAQAGLLFCWQAGPWLGEYSQYLALVGRPGWLPGEPLRPLMWLGEARLGWRALRGGFVWRTSPLRRDEMGNPAYVVTLGCRVNRFLEVGVTEDLPRFDTSPDIGFYLRLRVGR